MSDPLLSDLDLLHAAARLIDEARHDGLPPVCLAICNADGQLSLFLRMDGAPVRLIAIARAKAYTAARMGMATTDFARRLEREHLALADFCDSGLTSMQGGLPLLHAGKIIFGLGVSGRKTREDEALCRRLLALLLETASGRS